MAEGSGHTLQPAAGRCPWAGEDPLYVGYHDDEWGRPERDDHKLFEKLILEGFQAGLAWITVLRKREGFRAALHGFDPERLARLTEAECEALMADPRIIRNRLKIAAVVDNARAFLAIKERGTFAEFIWQVVDGRPKQNRFARWTDAPAQTAESQALSKILKNYGFRFVGPTTCYAYMQSMGLVNDHQVACPGHGQCAELGVRFSLTG